MTDLARSIRCASRLVGAIFDLEPREFMSAGKGPPDHVHARQVLVYLLTMEGGFEQLDVGRALGRHHSTIWHAVQKVEGLREEAEMDRALTSLAEMYRQITDAHARIPPGMHLDPST